MLAWFSPSPIPESVFLAENKQDPVNDLVDLLFPDKSIQAALADLAAYSLTTPHGRASTFSVHRLVQDVSRLEQQGDTTRDGLHGALAVLRDAFAGDGTDVRTWPTLGPLAPHLEAAVHQADDANIFQPTAGLMNNLAQFLFAKADYAAAEPLMRRVLAIHEQVDGPANVAVASGLNNLAGLLLTTNRLAEAEPLMRRALAINERSYGSDHTSVARSLTNLAGLLLTTNRLSEAEPLMRRALAMVEQSYGPDHPELAIRFGSLAMLLMDTNRASEAEPLMRRALAIDLKTYGPEHPKVAIRLDSLAALFEDTNRLVEAEQVRRRRWQLISWLMGRITQTSQRCSVTWPNC